MSSSIGKRRVSETAFIQHELREVPVKRGTATVKIKFEGIKHIDLKPSGHGEPPNVTITLNDGKTGDFVLAIAGSFKGQSDSEKLSCRRRNSRRSVK